MRRVAMTKKSSKPDFAQLSAKLADARAANDIARYDAIQSEIDAVKAAELERHPQRFAKSDQDKVRLLLLGWQEGGPGPKDLTLHFPEPGSFLEYECRWAVAELVRRGDGPTLHLVASLFVPDGKHMLAHPFLTARLVGRKAGAVANAHAVEQIASAVAAFQIDLKRDAAVIEVADWYGLSREYVYRCIRQDECLPRQVDDRPPNS